MSIILDIQVILAIAIKNMSWAFIAVNYYVVGVWVQCVAITIWIVTKYGYEYWLTAMKVHTIFCAMLKLIGNEI